VIAPEAVMLLTFDDAARELLAEATSAAKASR
jgi:hypothetical protein